MNIITKHRYFLSLAISFIIGKIFVKILTLGTQVGSMMEVIAPFLLIVIIGLSFTIFYLLFTPKGGNKQLTIQERKDWLLILLLPLIYLLLTIK